MFRNLRSFKGRTCVSNSVYTQRKTVVSDVDGSAVVMDVVVPSAPSVDEYNLKALLEAGVSLDFVPTNVVQPNGYDVDALTSMAAAAAVAAAAPAAAADPATPAAVSVEPAAPAVDPAVAVV